MEDAPEFEFECVICCDEEAILLGCGHRIGANCLAEQVKRISKGGELFMIGTNYARCAECRRWVDCKSHAGAADTNLLVQKTKARFEEMAGMFILATAQENVLSPQGVGFDFLDHQILFQCAGCTAWFYAGREDCRIKYAGGPHRLCASCCAKAKQQSLELCKHGVSMVLNKCDYCCSIAGWFKGGHHFCDTCYAKTGQDLSVRECRSNDQTHTPDQWDYCTGRHPPNGQSFSLGCLVCSKSLIYTTMPPFTTAPAKEKVEDNAK